MPTNLLKQKSEYFKNLSVDGQEKFIERLFVFMEEKNFVGHEGLLITDEIRVLISAAAIQLTFGLKNYRIENLHTINVFPRVFYSRFYETSFKGLTTQGGVLSLSWDDFKDGFADDTDKINLGLHELAHALNIDWEVKADEEDLFVANYEKWKTQATEHYEKLKTGTITFFRKYGATNLHEFFAVCIEHFFEVPENFKTELPILYGHTVLMLNQDPHNKLEDYRLKEMSAYFEPIKNSNHSSTQLVEIVERAKQDTIEPDNEESRFQRFVRLKGVYLAMVATFTGLFMGVPLIFWMSNLIIIEVGTIFIILFLCGGIGLLQWRYVRYQIDMHYHQFAMYAFTGFGIWSLIFLLFLNMMIPLSSHSETYSRDAFVINENNMNVSIGNSETSPLAKNLSSYLGSNYTEIPVSTKITITYNTGLIGFDVIENCEFH